MSQEEIGPWVKQLYELVSKGYDDGRDHITMISMYDNRRIFGCIQWRHKKTGPRSTMFSRDSSPITDHLLDLFDGLENCGLRVDNVMHIVAKSTVIVRGRDPSDTVRDISLTAVGADWHYGVLPYDDAEVQT